MIRLIKQSVFQGINFQLESIEGPKIKAAASSSSDVLNRYFDAVAQDIALITTFTNNLSTKADRLQAITASQGAAYLNMFNNLSSRVDAASGYDQILVDMRSDSYINTVDTTATVNKTFGQATLPVSSTQDLLMHTDVYGNKSISDELEFSYLENTSSTPPSNGNFQVAIDGLYMLREDQSWIRTSPSGSTQAFVKIKAPLQFRGLTPNLLELWPLPVGMLKLNGLWYQEAGVGSDGLWTAIDYSYITGYNTSTSKIDNLGPIRVHLPNTPIAQIALAFDVSSSLTWGIYKLKIYHNEYSSTGTLVVKDPYNRTVGDIVLRGKDPSDLSLLSVQKSSNEVQISLQSSDSSTTPVISGVIMAV
jgi:hypothetical protein